MSKQNHELQKLIAFKEVFSVEGKTVRTTEKSFSDNINLFINEFYLLPFANNDYTALDELSLSRKTVKLWVKDADVQAVCSLLTYIIWSNRTHPGYFFKKIKDGTIELSLLRLEELLNQQVHLN